jgi:hypothetical protein
MNIRVLAAALVAAVLLFSVRGARGAEDATLLRVFLIDGTSLVSYGEPAKVGDRIVFSMPTGAGPVPPLQLVDMPASRVDWDRTSRYAASARATHYLQTQAENDYAVLSNDVASTLNDVSKAAEPAKRIELVERARKTLAEWPLTHYNYRQNEVRQMLTMLDEAIADLRAAATPGRYELTLSAFVDPPTITEPLLPAPTAQESIEQTLKAARAVDVAADRTALLSAALATIDREKTALPADWVVAKRAETEAAIQVERRVDRSYQLLTRRYVRLANQSARAADVKSLAWLLTRIRVRDAALGARRPEAVAALIAEVEAKLDAARQLQLARERWALRAPELRSYRLAIAAPMDLFTELKASLEDIKALSGSPPGALAALEQSAARLAKLVAEVAPPQEAASAHALLLSAVQLAGNAALIRREAALAGDMRRAWDASSAAAGALMLGAKARTDIIAALRPPQISSPR